MQIEPSIIIINSHGETSQINLSRFDKDSFTIGRNTQENDIIISDSIVSNVHGYLLKKDGTFFYKDMNSKNGSYVETGGYRNYLHGNDKLIELSEGAVIRIGALNNPEKLVLIMFTYMKPDQIIIRYTVSDKPIIIGRSKASDIVLDHPSISRTHCRIERRDGRILLKDDRSRNGVLVNGYRVDKEQILKNKDIIQILGYQLIFCGRYIYYKKTARGISIKGRNINKWVGKSNVRKQILQNVDIDIKGNEFVAIIGGSGAGKSTLMNVINGTDRRFKGELYYDNISVENSFQHLKGIVGYVPQEDIIYENLKLRKMLYYTAMMRMPDDTDRQEIEDCIDSVLESLDLKEQQNTYIRKLSGGQKKRASIAVELLADPKLFFLDEPTSGLDPGTEKDLMLTLRDMSRTQDRTIVIVTHTTQNLDLCDKIIFMGQGGSVCFAGTIEEAKRFFETDDLTSIYNLIRKDTARWAGKFYKLKHQYKAEKNSGNDDKRKNIKSRHASSVNQYIIITRRYIELICNDMKRLIVLAFQPVLIGILLAVVSDNDLFEIYESTKSMMFVLSCSAIWIGVFDSIQEICKERNILRREYMVCLKMPVYILSKLTVQIILGAIQSVFLVTTFVLLVEENRKGILFDSFYFELTITTWLTLIASVSLGFIISAIVRSGDKAMAAAPFVLIVQLLFSGILFELKGAAEYISYVTISRWSVEAMGSIAHLNNLDLRLQSDFPALVHESESLFEDTKHHLLMDWSILLCMSVILTVISLIIIRNVAKDER